MPYFRNNQGDFVDDTGTVVSDPNTRLQIGQSVGGDIGKLPAYTGPVPGTPPPNQVQPTNAPNVPTPQVTGDSVSNAYNQYTDLLSKQPNSYDLYKKELESRGVNTLAEQERSLGESALKQEQALRPLLPENVQFEFPKSMQQLQQVGVTQDQLNLLAAKERAPIAQGLKDLLTSRSLVAQQIDRQVSFAQYLTGLQVDDYNTRINNAKLQYEFAKEVLEGTELKQEEARTFALENGVTKPFYQIGSTIYQTATGKAYATPEQFFKDAGVSDFGQAAPLIQNVGAEQAARLQEELAIKTRNSYPKSGTTTTNNDVEQFAQDVFSGNLSLTGVPIKIRAQVSKRVEELQNSRYDTEFDARVDYDSTIRQLETELGAGESLALTPTEIIGQLVSRFGKYISQQEIEATIFNLLGVGQRPSASSTPTSSPTTSTPSQNSTGVFQWGTNASDWLFKNVFK